MPPPTIATVGVPLPAARAPRPIIITAAPAARDRLRRGLPHVADLVDRHAGRTGDTSVAKGLADRVQQRCARHGPLMLAQRFS
jgi:hypothetical protein